MLWECPNVSDDAPMVAQSPTVEAQLNTLIRSLGQRAAQMSSEQAAVLEGHLLAILTRVRAGEYELTDFLARRSDDHARRLREAGLYTEGWLRHGRTWAQLLRRLPMDTYATAVDLCPGWAPKIELGLLLCRWRGHLTLLDRDPEATSRLSRFLETFLPAFSVSTLAEDVYETDARADLVLANHVIDDLLLDAVTPARGLVYEDEGALQTAHERLAEERERALEELMPRISAAVLSLLSGRGAIVLVQYPSYVESLLPVEGGSAVVAEAFQRIKVHLQDAGLRPLSGAADSVLELGSAATFGPEHVHILVV